MVFKQPLQPARPNYRETMWIKGPSGLCCLEMWLGRAGSGEGGGGEFGGRQGLGEGRGWERGRVGRVEGSLGEGESLEAGGGWRRGGCGRTGGRGLGGNQCGRAGSQDPASCWRWFLLLLRFSGRDTSRLRSLIPAGCLGRGPSFGRWATA